MAPVRSGARVDRITGMFRYILYFMLFVVVSAGTVSCKGGGSSSSGPRDGSPVLVSVNGEDITVNDFKREAAKLEAADVQLLADEDNRNLFLDSIIVRRLLVQAGNKEGLDRDPLLVAHINRVRDDKVKSLYVKQEVSDKVSVSDSDVREYFEKNKDRLGSVRLSRILVDSEEGAQEVLVKYKNGEPFNALALKYSKDEETRRKGGDTGFRSWTEMAVTPELREEAFSLEPGSVGGVVYEKGGFYVLKVTDRKPATESDYEDIREPLMGYLARVRRDELYDAKVGELRSDADIYRNEASIEELSFLNLAELAAPRDAE